MKEILSTAGALARLQPILEHLSKNVLNVSGRVTREVMSARQVRLFVASLSCWCTTSWYATPPKATRPVSFPVPSDTPSRIDGLKAGECASGVPCSWHPQPNKTAPEYSVTSRNLCIVRSPLRTWPPDHLIGFSAPPCPVFGMPHVPSCY